MASKKISQPVLSSTATLDTGASSDTASSELMRVMYSSVNVVPYNAASIKALLDTCIRNNQQNDITGALMIDGALNVQYIEGPPAAIEPLWERISNDKRHHFVVQLYEEQGMLPRLFGQWAMLHGQSSRAEMLLLIRNAYSRSQDQGRPSWSLAIAPLVILLDRQYSAAYARAAL